MTEPSIPPAAHPSISMKRPRTLGQKPKAERRRQVDADRRHAQAWRSWYGLAIWRDIKRRQLDRQPLCERHLKRGLVVLATVVNHVGRHRGDWERFISGPFESSCKACHDSEIQREERAEGRRAIEARQGGGAKV